MSLIDAARELFDEAPVYDVQGDSVNRCNYCDEPLYDATRQPLGEHESDCPWLSMPKIVAVLERLAILERHGLDFDEHMSETLGPILDLSTDCLCFDEPVIHGEDCERRKMGIGG